MKLTDSQLVILSASSRRENGAILPLSRSLRLVAHESADHAIRRILILVFAQTTVFDWYSVHRLSALARDAFSVRGTTFLMPQFASAIDSKVPQYPYAEDVPGSRHQHRQIWALEKSYCEKRRTESASPKRQNSPSEEDSLLKFRIPYRKFVRHFRGIGASQDFC